MWFNYISVDVHFTVFKGNLNFKFTGFKLNIKCYHTEAKYHSLEVN